MPRKCSRPLGNCPEQNPFDAAVERLPCLFVFALMAHPLTLPAVGASLFLALLGGMQLGQSTVRMINPVHFQGPAIHPRDRGAAIDEQQVRSTAPSFASLYGWDRGRSARIEDCGDCEALTARDAYRDTYAEYVEPVRIHRGAIETLSEPEAVYERTAPLEDPDVHDFDAELKQRVARDAYYEIETPVEVVEESAPASE